MLSRRDIYEAVPDGLCASPEAAARLRGAIFVNATLRTSTLNCQTLTEVLAQLIAVAGTPETMDRAWGLDGVHHAVIDAIGTWHDACFDHNTGAVLDGLGDEERVGVEVLREERLWVRPRRARAIVTGSATGKLAVVRDDDQVYFSSGSDWRPAKCGPGGFEEGEWVYLKDGALRAFDLTTRSRRTIVPASQLTDRLWELTACSVGASATESRSEFSPGKMPPAVVPAQAGPLFCLSGCRPVERILVLDGRGNALLSHNGERCCGHMDWAVPAGGGWLVPHSHAEGVELIQSGGHGVRVRIEPGGRLAVVPRSAAEAKVGVFYSGRFELLGPDLQPSLSLPIPWQDRTNVATQSIDGSRIAIGSAGGQVGVLARDGHVLGRLTLDWEVHAITFLDNDRILVAHGPGFITTIRILDRIRFESPGTSAHARAG